MSTENTRKESDDGCNKKCRSDYFIQMNNHKYYIQTKDKYVARLVIQISHAPVL